jgi:hypothetical protein
MTLELIKKETASPVRARGVLLDGAVRLRDFDTCPSTSDDGGCLSFREARLNKGGMRFLDKLGRKVDELVIFKCHSNRLFQLFMHRSSFERGCEGNVSMLIESHLSVYCQVMDPAIG